MFLKTLELQNFRCFSKKNLEFTHPITFLTGNNGVGKTSILEAIYYLCYLKSFRSHIVQDVVYNQSESFFLKASFDRKHEIDTINHTLQIGYFQKKKSIKLDQKSIVSYKQILSYFQVISLTEDDIDLIKGYPTVRRSFIDQAVLFSQPETFDEYSKFKQILQHRNALLAQQKKIEFSEMEIWNHGVWQSSIQIQKYRINTLKTIEKAVNIHLEKYFDGIYEVTLKYDPKFIDIEDTYEIFTQKTMHLIDQEKILKRSMFGAHLDDILIQIKGKKARIYASRGQQKLISMLCKVSWASMVGIDNIYPIMLIDDFISDFDHTRLSQMVDFFLDCKNQIILTAPFCDPSLERLLKKANPEIISI